MAFEFAKRGEAELLRPVLAGGFNATAINEQDKHGRTPLMLACIYSKFNTMRELLDAGADTSFRDDERQFSSMLLLEGTSRPSESFLMPGR